MPDPSSTATLSSTLDLALFHVPTEVRPGEVEGRMDNRRDERAERKARFWRWLSQRIDLTGEGSPVTEGIKGSGLRQAMAGLKVTPEVFNESHEDRWEGQQRGDLTKSRDIERPPEVESAMKEASVQYFLRNVPRLERSNDIELARPPLSYVEWTDHHDDYFADVRAFTIEPPPRIEEFTTSWFPKLAREIRDNVLGFDWQYATDDFVRKTRGYFPFKTPPPPRISINDLSTQPAPPYRPTAKERHVQAMKQLGKLIDGTK